MYCPVIPWIITHYNTIETPTVSMQEGNLDYEEKTRITREALGEDAAIVYEKHLEHGDLAGRADAVTLGENNTAIIEIKRYSSPYRLDKIQQLKTYATLMALSEKPPKKMILIQAGKKTYEKTYTAEDKDETLQIINQILKIIDSETPPPAQPSNKCRSCWYRRICPYHEV